MMRRTLLTNLHGDEVGTYLTSGLLAPYHSPVWVLMFGHLFPATIFMTDRAGGT